MHRNIFLLITRPKAPMIHCQRKRIPMKVGLAICCLLAPIAATSAAPVNCANVKLPPINPTSLFAALVEKKYPGTVNVADLDGDQKMEIVARGVDGIHIWKYDTQSFEWKQSPVADVLTGPPWDLPLYHRSIRLFDLNGDRRPELLVKGPNGVQAWEYQPASDSWLPFNSLEHSALEQAYDQALKQPRVSLPQAATPFPQFAGNQLVAYQYISSQLLNGAANADIRKQYPNTALTPDFASQYPSTVKGLSPPSGVSQSDWQAVTTQLLQEFRYVTDVSTWFSQLEKLYTNQGISNIISAVTVANVLSIPNPSSNATGVLLNIGYFATQIVSTLTSIELPPVSVIVGLMNAAFGAAEAAEAGGDTTNFASTVATVDGDLGKLFTNNIVANGCELESYMTDWSLLESLGKPIGNATYVWDDTLTGRLLQAAKTPYETTLYQTLTPVVWEVQQRCSNSRPGYQCEGPPTQYKLWVPSRHGYLFISLAGHAEDPPPNQAQAAIFAAPPDGVGAPLSDVMNSQNGWKMPFGGVASPSPESSRAAAVQQTEAALQAIVAGGDDEATKSYLAAPLQAALVALRQAETTKGSTLIQTATDLVNTFAARADVISDKLGADRVTAIQKASAQIETSLLPTTKAVATARQEIGYQRRSHLDGRGSASVDGSELTYHWRSIGRRAQVQGGNTAEAAAWLLEGPGKYQFELTVEDSFGNTSSDIATIEYRGSN